VLLVPGPSISAVSRVWLASSDSAHLESCLHTVGLATLLVLAAPWLKQNLGSWLPLTLLPWGTDPMDPCDDSLFLIANIQGVLVQPDLDARPIL